MDVLIRKHFGLALGAGSPLDTLDTANVTRLVRAAAESKTLVSIAGPRGSGKTYAVRMAVRGLDVRIVEPLRLDRERLHLGDIQDAIVSQLSDEKPRRSGEARSGQVRRILGRTGGTVLLWIDDAHVLHPSTLRGLKRLLELTWRRQGPLLGIVLTGQQDRTERIAEVGLRSTRLALAGLQPGEAELAIERILGDAGDGETSGFLSRSPEARNWLELDALIDKCLVVAVGRSEERVTAAIAREVLGAPAPESVAPSAEDAMRFLNQGRRAA